jgi:hypothetical protein
MSTRFGLDVPGGGAVDQLARADQRHIDLPLVGNG